MKVLLLSPLPPPVGGIATWTGLVLQAAKSDGDVDIDLLDTAVKGRSIVAPSLIGRILVGGGHAVLIALSFFWRCIFRRPNVVHVCTPSDLGLIRDIVLTAVARIFFIPVVVHFHRGKVPDYPDLMSRPTSFEALLVRVIVFVANRVIVLNEPAIRALRPFGGDKLSVLPNLVECSESTLRTAPKQHLLSDIIILFVGHVVERKGVFDLVTACSLLRKASFDITLRVVGPYVEDVRSRLMETASDGVADSAEWLVFLGNRGVDEVRAEMNAATLFCLPSYAEGFPYVILEAMAVGLPIVSSNVGAIPRALEHGAGLCIQPGDVDSLVRAIKLCALDPKGAVEMGLRAHEKCKSLYSTSAVFNRLKEEWRAAI